MGSFLGPYILEAPSIILGVSTKGYPKKETYCVDLLFYGSQ